MADNNQLNNGDLLNKQKPKTLKGRRIIKDKSAKLRENPKKLLIFLNKGCKEAVNGFFRDLALIKKPLSKSIKRKKAEKPFEDAMEIEKFCKKDDCSLFAIGTHTKKLPNGVVFGRLFNGSVLDMKTRRLSVGSNGKPVLIFSGSDFSEKFETLKNFMMDFFRGFEITTCELKNIEHVILFRVADDGAFLLLNSFVIRSKPPYTPETISAEEMGPALKLRFKRTFRASAEVQNDARKISPAVVAKKKKNVEHNPLGDVIGRVYVDRQKISEIQQKKFKGYRKIKQNKEKTDK